MLKKNQLSLKQKHHLPKRMVFLLIFSKLKSKHNYQNLYFLQVLIIYLYLRYGKISKSLSIHEQIGVLSRQGHH